MRSARAEQSPTRVSRVGGMQGAGALALTVTGAALDGDDALGGAPVGVPHATHTQATKPVMHGVE